MTTLDPHAVKRAILALDLRFFRMMELGIITSEQYDALTGHENAIAVKERREMYLNGRSS